MEWYRFELVKGTATESMIPIKPMRSVSNRPGKTEKNGCLRPFVLPPLSRAVYVGDVWCGSVHAVTQRHIESA